jgi:hypothetical protein
MYYREIKDISRYSTIVSAYYNLCLKARNDSVNIMYLKHNPEEVYIGIFQNVHG